MAGEEPQTIQPKRPRSRAGDSTVGIIILALIVFFFVNGPGSHASQQRGSSTESNFSESAVLGGVDRQNNSQHFHGGEASAFMGGVKLDLRDAVMDGSEATIDVTSVMGGIELHIPKTWTVVNRVTPVLGGVENHTYAGDGEKRLVIEGTVLMGGLDIRN
jgi:hypothetical protein